MENQRSGSLRESDRKLLRKIESLYEIGSQLLGNEPYIYSEFNVKPVGVEFGSTEKLSGMRQDAFRKGSGIKTSSRKK